MAQPPDHTYTQQASSHTDRSDLVRQLAAVEQALACLPDGAMFQVSRAPLLMQQEELKKAISNSRPFGARLDGCKAALARARSRLDEATNNVLVAQQQQTEASNQVMKLEADLKDLEQSVVEQDATQEKADCLQHLQKQMAKVVEEMVTSGNVQRGEVDETVKQMEVLFGGLQTIHQRASSRTAETPQQPSVIQMLQRNGVPTRGAGVNCPLDGATAMETSLGALIPDSPANVG